MKSEHSYLYYLWPLCLQTTKTTTTNHDAIPPPKAWVCCRLARTECVNRAEPIAFFSCRIINIILRMITNIRNIMANVPNMMKEDNWPVKASTISLSGLPGKWQIFLANLRHNNILRQNIFGEYSWHIWQLFVTNILGKPKNNNYHITERVMSPNVLVWFVCLF